MVKARHVLRTVMQCLSIVTMVTFLFMGLGYSLAFGPPNPEDGGHSSLFYGDSSRFWFWGINPASVHVLAPTIPESVFALYQLMFAIITHALICGSMAERLNFYSMMITMCLWHVAVYCPIAHANWYYIHIYLTSIA
jgi:Amt family ammonium transporter